jgi:regulator of replication initiation timing
LGATAKNHQEKIEELFLHLIEMEKRLRALETENARLKTELQHLKP